MITRMQVITVVGYVFFVVFWIGTAYYGGLLGKGYARRPPNILFQCGIVDLLLFASNVLSPIVVTAVYNGDWNYYVLLASAIYNLGLGCVIYYSSRPNKFSTFSTRMANSPKPRHKASNYDETKFRSFLRACVFGVAATQLAIWATNMLPHLNKVVHENMR